MVEPSSRNRFRYTNPGGGGGGSGGRITILTDSNINQENFNINGGQKDKL